MSGDDAVAPAPPQPGHLHSHRPNRFAVMPTGQRLGADATRTGRGVTIAFLDSGFTPHPDLGNRIAAYHDASGDDSPLNPAGPPDGWRWHGTQTSTVAAGDGRLSDGRYRGLAPEAQVVLVKVGSAGRIPDANIIRGLEWVIANRERYGIRVVSISLGADHDVSYLDSTIDRLAEDAVRSGLVLVVAAGNGGCSEHPRPIPPANAPSVITVGGYDDHNWLPGPDDDDLGHLSLYCSNFGLTLDGLLKPEVIAPARWVAAPILTGSRDAERAEALCVLAEIADYELPSQFRILAESAGVSGAGQGAAVDEIRAQVERALREARVIAPHYQHVDGTSFAAPIVASVVAQMLEANPRLTPAAVKALLIATADRLPRLTRERQGYGAVNAQRAVQQSIGDPHRHALSTVGPPFLDRDTIVFAYHDDRATEVRLAGDFNQWDPSRDGFVRGAEGFWTARVTAPVPGRYHYKLVVDGRWLDDPGHGLKLPDPYGGFNSVLHIAGPAM